MGNKTSSAGAKRKTKYVNGHLRHIHERMMKNGYFWERTPHDVREQIRVKLTFIGCAMDAAHSYWLQNRNKDW